MSALCSAEDVGSDDWIEAKVALEQQKRDYVEQFLLAKQIPKTLRRQAADCADLLLTSPPSAPGRATPAMTISSNGRAARRFAL